MPIYTQHGEEVRIVGLALDPHGLTVQSVADPQWIRVRQVADLKADDGIKEIRAAIEEVK